MIRRRLSMLVVMSILVLPHTVGALPRQGCVTPNDCVGFQGGGTSFVLVENLTIFPDGATVETKPLIKGVPYRFKVTGTWRWSSASTTRHADAAFSTADGWSSASKVPGGRSLEIAGEKLSSSTITYTPSHDYNVDRISQTDSKIGIRIHDDSYSDGNSGSLSVAVYRAQRVMYGGDPIVPVGLATTDVPKMTLIPTTALDPAPEGVSRTVDPIDVPPIPRVATIKGSIIDNGYCLTLNTPQTGDSAPACMPNLFNAGPFSTDIGPIPGFQVCSAGSCNIDPQPVTVTAFEVGPYSIPDSFWLAFLGERPFKPGSGIRVEVEWEADRDHLFLAASALGGQNQYSAYLPFDSASTSEVNWFNSNRNNLSATFNVAILFPDGTFGPPDGEQDPSYILPQGIKVPGLGQFIEAAFSSRVAGQ